MKVINICQECDGELETTTKVRPNGDIEVCVDLCPTCIARKVQLAKENGWIYDNIMRKGKVTG